MSRIRKRIEEIHFDRNNESLFVKVLKPVSYIYNKVTGLRRDIYSKRLLKSGVAGCYTIAVGNLTYGGTGKTPVVISLAGMFSDRGFRVGIVHSGYGSPQHKNKKVRRGMNGDEGPLYGDEAAELFVRAKDALVYSSRNRAEAIERAILEGGVNVCILDDAFQYLKIASNLKILVVDYQDRFGNEHCLPAGPMRESKKALLDADVVWFVSQQKYEIDRTMEKDFREINNSLRFIYSHFRPDSLIRISDMKVFGIPQGGRRVVSFSGIGRDKRFTQMLNQIGVEPLGHLSFGDHYRYRDKDIEKINSTARKCGADMVITTEKDYLRDTKMLSKVEGLHILRINLEITEGGSELERLCDSLA
ncbi:MAG: tetraacyldisaccharide 4'-kinase [Deltaproteobacteria bacterium]|nr:tetraacyldisaccharide 4'-kinase [Deltaproteobacteria bacterium]